MNPIRTFRVMVALSLATAAGRKKLNGIHRFLSEGYDWDMELLRSEGDLTADALSAADRSRFDGMLVGFAGKCKLRTLHADKEIPTVFIDRADVNTLESLPLSMFVNDNVRDIAQTAAKHLLGIQRRIAETGGHPPQSLAIVVGLSSAAYRRPDGVYVLPITALKT